MAIIGQGITAYPQPDDALNENSQNPVQNKVVAEEINDAKNVNATQNERIDYLEQVMTATTTGPTPIVTFDAFVSDLSLNELTVNIKPVQAGGTSSPENVRPITGWTGCKLYQSKKNIFDFNNADWLPGLINEQGVINASGDYSYTQNYSPIKGGSKIAVSVTRTGAAVSRGSPLSFYDKQKNFLERILTVPSSGGTEGRASAIIDVPEDAAYYRLNIGRTGFSDYMIEYADEATEYEPITNINNISWLNTVGAIYGGTLDVASGVLTVNSFYCETNAEGKLVRYMPGAEPTTASCAWMQTYAYYSLSTSAGAFSADKVQGCNRYDTENGQGVVALDNNCKIREADNYTRLTFKQTSIPGWGTEGFTKDNIEAYFAENPLQVVIPLSTPYSIQLTPTEVATLLGINNIWADCGDVNVTYGAYLETLKASLDSTNDELDTLRACIAPIEDGATASQSYAQGAFFFRNGSFCTALTSIDSGAAFTLGTNYQTTTVAAALISLQS